MNFSVKSLMTAAAGIAAAAVIATSAFAASVTGAGATFPYPIYAKWAGAYAGVSGFSLNYQSIGSGGGIAQIKARTVTFGATDAPLKIADLNKFGLAQFPTVIGGVVPVVNVSGVAPGQLILDGATLANIFLGHITNWSDPAIKALNPGVNLPNQAIAVVHRSDGSGTTFVFSTYLSRVSNEWKTNVGAATSVDWPLGIGAKGNEGVAGQVKQLSGAVGYVELIYAKQNQMPYADMKNAAGNFITPTLDSVTAALATAKIPDDFRFSMVNAPGDNTYPIAGTTWLLVYEKQKDPAKGKKLVEFLNWALTKGEGMAASLDYASLPESVQQRVLERIKTIKY